MLGNDPILKAGMPFMDMKSAINAMYEQATKIGGKVVKEDGAIVLKDKNGKKIACVFTYDAGYKDGSKLYRYNDWEGREYVGQSIKGDNPDGKFTKIYSKDGVYVANDKDGNGIVSENEIDINM